MSISIDYKIKTYLTKNSLIIMTPAQKLTGFTLYSGNIYQITTTRIPETIERNGTELTLVGSIGAVDDTTKYYYDSGIVYVYLPSTDYFTLFFNMYFGDRGFKLPKDLDLTGSAEVVYFEPRIKGNPGFSRTQKDKMQGISLVADADFQLIDTNEEYFESLGDLVENRDYSFFEKDVKIYRFLGEESVQEVHKVFSGQVYDWSVDRQKVSFRAKDFVRLLNKSVQTAEYNITDYPNCDPAFVGRIIRQIYGECMVKCVNIDYEDDNPTTSDNRVWKISEHPNYAVDEVWVRETKLTETTHYTLNGDKNEITFVSNLETLLGWTDLLQGAEEVYTLVRGKMDGSSNLMDNASDIVKDILTTIGFSSSGLDLTSFSDAKTANNYEIAFSMPQYVDGERPTAKEVIEKINASVLGFLSMDNDFLIRYDIYSEGSSDINLDADYDLQNRIRSAETPDMASMIIVNFNFNEKRDTSRSKTVTDDDALYLHKTSNSHTIESVLLLEAEAEDLGEDYIDYYKHPAIFENFTVKLQIDDKKSGDFIEVDGNKCELIQLSKSINDTGVSARRV